jgi:glycosyltransferase involved in cell wall biosynthesis
MHIALLNERFIFRYGVDRTLLCLARELKQAGCTVTLVGQKFDEFECPDFYDHKAIVPQSEKYIESELSTANWIQQNWGTLFPDNQRPDVALVAGWPFLQSIPVLKSFGISVWFQDYGITPLDGLPEGAVRTLEMLKSLRDRFVPECDGVIAISDFIAESQSRSTFAHGKNVHVVRLASDHVRRPLWGGIAEDRGLHKFRYFFSIGRFEAGNYKQSEHVFEFARKLKKSGFLGKVLVLAEKDIFIPTDCLDLVAPTGFLSDAELFSLMAKAEANLCFSKWEGFNLPLAESQALGVPCLVYKVGAHPEVAADPWLLSDTLDEMADKAQAVLDGTCPESISTKACFTSFAATNTWKNAARQVLDILSDSDSKRPERKLSPLMLANLLIIDVTNASRDTANSGVVRVSRQLAAQLSKISPVLFTCWDPEINSLRFPTKDELQVLSSFDGPKAPEWHPISTSLETPSVLWEWLNWKANVAGWLLLPEIKPADVISNILNQAQSWSLRVAAIFYDAIPVLRPDLVLDLSYATPHSNYMKALSGCDIVLSISDSSNNDLMTFWKNSGLRGSARSAVLPGGLIGDRPTATITHSEASKTILCVSTLEPRKNHRRLIEAFKSFRKSSLGDGWQLLLVGNKYAGAFDIADWVIEVCKEDSTIQYLGVVDDSVLRKLYSDCAFTIYPSEIEGFGLPILESLWYSKPCICHCHGVMNELAVPGGCLTVNVLSPESIAEGIKRLAGDSSLRSRLSREAKLREIKTWKHYASEVIGLLELVSHTDPKWRKQEHPDLPPLTIPKILYSDCVLDCWQMHDSERIALLGVLSKLKPEVAVEVGTFRGGSLSLIRQYARRVFSIDIDPDVASRYAFMDNVTFLTGSSLIALPQLISELNVSGLSPSFFLIDGDHSSEGVRNDLESLLDYTPLLPTIVMMHDMGNPECRKGALSVNWSRSPHVHSVDLDFVPGRIVEHSGSGSGEIWGGLGLLLMLPERRQAPLTIGRGFQRSLDALLHSTMDRDKAP